MKYFQLLIVVLSSLVIATAGCTSKNVEKEDSEVAELTGEESSADSTEESGDEVADEITSEEAGGDSAFDESEDVASEEGESEEGDAIEESEDSGEIAELGEEEEGAEGEEGETDELETGDSTDVAGDLQDSSAATDDLGGLSEDSSTSSKADTAMEDSSAGSLSGDEMSGLSEEPTYRPVIPLKKMETTPYTKAGVLVNAIYVARDGDSLEGVSQKIYGTDKVAELKSVNGHVANRSLKVGDKIYYNSPQRPTDNSQILTYYEDIGLTAEVYEVQGDSENIRTISKKLLGNENSWKEVWSTNLDVESKDVLTTGTRLRYWGSEVANAAAPALAATTPAAAPAPTPSPAPSFEEPPAPPPSEPQASEIAQNDMGGDASAVGSVEPPPPPPPMEMAPPPPPPVEGTPAAAEEEPAGGIDALAGGDEQMFLIIGGALSLAGVILLIIIIRKKRAKRGIDFQTATHTQIE